MIPSVAFGNPSRGLAAGPSALRILALALCAIWFVSGEGRAVSARENSQPRASLEKLEIVTASGTHAFSVEVMRTGPARERGLMFRRFLAPDRGMLFDFEVERPVMMWMKNTYLPLDMIFLDHSGRVVALAENTVPQSEKIIPSGAPAYGVLEVNAGTAARIGLKIGDFARHPMFAK
ncbi:MAG: DUF192 domain-containing protein [Methylocapsa sp.]|nr:DUF192 domain-containing protein [Methylocapsa sp.]